MGARWVVLGAVLAGCVFTPRPMIPIEADDNDAANRTADAATPRDAGASSDHGPLPPTDTGLFPTDTTPPSFDASAGADVPTAMSPDAGAALDGGAPDDAPGVDAGTTEDAAGDLGAECGAPDGGDGGRCGVDATVDVTLDVTLDAGVGLVDP